jgi:hypothetical protein
MIEDKLLEGNSRIDISHIKEEKGFRQIYHKFFLSVEEVKFGESKIGYIFKFELFNENNLNQSESDISSSKLKINSLSKFKNPTAVKDVSEINPEMQSSISFAQPVKPPERKEIIFNATPENPNGINLGLDITYIPKINKENQFSIDVDKMSYKQMVQLEKDNNNSPIHQLYDEAVKKLAELKKIKKMEKKDSNQGEEEEEEDESSYTYSDSSNSENETSNKDNSETKDELTENKKKKNPGKV